MSLDRWGATPADWRLWGHYLGLEADLLPTVSNPYAQVDPESRLAALGKVPSLYTGRGTVVGIRSWPERRATVADIRAWAQQPDYGICLQTRTVAAIDIDVDDRAAAADALQRIEAALGERLPRRRRGAHSRSLLLLRVEAPADTVLTKRILRLPAHRRNGSALIEFLAVGQQCVVAGTHPSGDRYEWDWPAQPGPGAGLETCIPAVPLDRFDACWDALAEALGATDWQARPRQRGETLDVEDPVARWLLSEECVWPVLGVSRDGGRVYVRCPWEAGHSTAGDETSSAWLVAGTAGYPDGHYRCLHATCATRTRDEFLRASGFTGSRFAALNNLGATPVAQLRRPPLDAPLPDPDAGEDADARAMRPDIITITRVEDLPPFARNPRTGAITGSIHNYCVALIDHRVSGDDWALDEFSGELMVRDGGAWRGFVDADYTRLLMRLERAGLPTTAPHALRPIVESAAQSPLRRVDLMGDWLDTLRWDGRPRVERFLIAMADAEPSEYAAAVSQYLWTAMAARALTPGAKADMVPVLISREGSGKSSLVRAIAPWPGAYGSISFSMSDADIARTGRGKVVRELEELRGLRSRDAEAIKAWVTTAFDEWVPKFKEAAVVRPRRWIVIGTTNDTQFLDSGSANRRWLPLHVDIYGRSTPWKSAKKLNQTPDLRDQLWAEAVVMYQTGGVHYGRAHQLAVTYRRDAEVEDATLAALHLWLSTEERPGVPRWREPFTYAEALSGVSALLPRGAKVADHRLSNLLRALYRFNQVRPKGAGGSRPRMFAPSPETAGMFATG